MKYRYFSFEIDRTSRLSGIGTLVRLPPEHELIKSIRPTNFKVGDISRYVFVAAGDKIDENLIGNISDKKT